VEYHNVLGVPFREVEIIEHNFGVCWRQLAQIICIPDEQVFIAWVEGECKLRFASA
jgi:isoleucyl-tRNA synthetase